MKHAAIGRVSGLGQHPLLFPIVLEPLVTCELLVFREVKNDNDWIVSWRHRNTLKTEYRDVAKFGIALALGARDFAGSNPVIPTIPVIQNR